MDDLESCDSFTCTRCHDDKNAVLPACDGFNGVVDSLYLIIARLVGVCIKIIWRVNNGHLLVSETFCSTPTADEFVRCRERVQRQGALFTGKEIMLHETVSVATEGERHVEYLSVLHCLLHTAADGFVVVFGFNDSDRQVIGTIQDVVGFLALLPVVVLTQENNTPVREIMLTSDLAFRPSPVKNCRIYILGTDVRFC